MNGPSAQALREGGVGGSLRYKSGVTLIVRMANGGPAPSSWKKKTTLQSVFGDYGQVLRIDVPEGQGIAYVEYDDKRDAEDAERYMKGKKICGCDVTVQVMTGSAMGTMGGRVGTVSAGTGDIASRIAVMAAEHNLDEAAAARLTSVFGERVRLGCDLNRDIDELSQHLAASNKPSALVSMKLAELRSGQPIGACKYNKGQGKGKEEPRRYEGGVSHSGSREGRSDHRDRDRDRERDRDRDRDRDRRDRDRDRRDRSRERRSRSRRREKETRDHKGDKARRRSRSGS